MIENKMIKEIGLSDNEILIYKILLSLGEIGIKEIISRVKLKRATIYNILKSLKDKSLIDESKFRGKKTFLPKSPMELDNMFSAKIKGLQASQIELQKVLPDILMDFQLSAKTPLITSFKGIEGLRKIYNHVSKVRKTLYIFASYFDRPTAEFSNLINSQIEHQGRLKIKSKAITPIEVYSREYWEFASKNLVEIRFNGKNFRLPAQILIYGDNVAFTAFKGEYISTLISNSPIAKSLRIIFETMWAHTKKPEIVNMKMQIKNGGKND